MYNCTTSQGEYIVVYVKEVEEKKKWVTTSWTHSTINIRGTQQKQDTLKCYKIAQGYGRLRMRRFFPSKGLDNFFLHFFRELVPGSVIFLFSYITFGP